MPTPLFASPFPRLDLSIDEQETLSSTATTLVDDAQTRFEQYLWRDRCQVDAAQWAPVREREDVRVFHDRRPGAGTGVRDMHLLLVVGSVIGTLHDAMYGVLNHTTEDMRVKTAYVQDTLLDSAVLHTILEPTREQPFRSMTVRWFVKGVPLHVRAISKHRDNVYLEATGTRQLSNGETVGYHLMHSLAFPRTPHLPSYDRFNMSICTLWRQVSAQRVQAYMTSYIEIKESFIVPMVVKSTADAIVSLWKVIECAQLKKLAWLVRRKRSISEMDGADRASALQDGCSVCGSQSRSVHRGLKSACAVCSKYTCNKCRVKRELSIFAPDGQLLAHQMRFCLPCLTSASRLDAIVVAQSEMPKRLVGGSRSGRSDRSGGSSVYGGGLPSSSSSSLFSSEDCRLVNDKLDFYRSGGTAATKQPSVASTWSMSSE